MTKRQQTTLCGADASNSGCGSWWWCISFAYDLLMLCFYANEAKHARYPRVKPEKLQISKIWQVGGVTSFEATLCGHQSGNSISK